MNRKKALLAMGLLLFLIPALAGAAQEQLTKERIVDIATIAVKDKGIELKEVNIIYDDGNKLWAERIGYLTEEGQDKNHGILVRGFLKNYYTVYFDFKEPVIKDVWVFIDKDTGEVLEVYREE